MKNAQQIALLLVTLIASNAHALCLKEDGSLDDSSMNTASIERHLLPMCDDEVKTTNKHEDADTSIPYITTGSDDRPADQNGAASN